MTARDEYDYLAEEWEKRVVLLPEGYGVDEMIQAWAKLVEEWEGGLKYQVMGTEKPTFSHDVQIITK
jgi:hypothetical protein